jgi:hypothetical protein
MVSMIRDGRASECAVSIEPTLAQERSRSPHSLNEPWKSCRLCRDVSGHNYILTQARDLAIQSRSARITEESEW